MVNDEATIYAIATLLRRGALSPEFQAAMDEHRAHKSSETSRKPYEVLAKYLVENATDDVHHLEVHKKLVPGLRKVNDELREKIGRVLVFEVDFEKGHELGELTDVYLEDKEKFAPVDPATIATDPE